MSMRVRFLAIPAASLTVGLSLLLAAEADACSCAFYPEPKRFAASDGAVVVRLKDVIDTDPSRDGEKHVYRVLRVYKGPPSLERRETLTLKTSSQSSACGLGHGKREKGLYLAGRGGRWSSSLCSETTPEAMRRAANGRGARSAASGDGCARNR